MESCIVILVEVRDEAPAVEVRLPVRVAVAIEITLRFWKISLHAAADDPRSFGQPFNVEPGWRWFFANLTVGFSL